MGDEDLHRLLMAGAPPVARRTASLQGAIDEVVVASRPVRRRQRLVVAGAGLSVLLLGGTSAALASQPVLEWLGFTPDRSVQHVNADGGLCSVGMIVRPEGVPVSDASYLAAQKIVVGIDFDALVIPAEVRADPQYSEAAASARASVIAEYNAAHPEATIPPAPHDTHLDMVYATTYALVTDGLKKQGLDPSHVSLEAGGTCDGGAE